VQYATDTSEACFSHHSTLTTDTLEAAGHAHATKSARSRARARTGVLTLPPSTGQTPRSARTSRKSPVTQEWARVSLDMPETVTGSGIGPPAGQSAEVYSEQGHGSITMCASGAEAAKVAEPAEVAIVLLLSYMYW